MDGENDGTAAQTQVAGEQMASGDQTAQAQVTTAARQEPGTGEGTDALTRVRGDYEAALAKRDAKIAELEDQIAEAAKTAEGAEKLRTEMDELRRRGEEERVGFELQLAGARNVKAARALLPDHDNDIEKLKAAEPWLFGGAAPAQTGATGLPSAGATGPDGSAQLSRWRKIAGLPESEE